MLHFNMLTETNVTFTLARPIFYVKAICFQLRGHAHDVCMECNNIV